MFVSSVAAISNFARRLRKDQAGVTAIEYGLIAGAIAVAIIAAAFTLGGNLSTKFTCVGTSISSGTDTCTAAAATN